MSQSTRCFQFYDDMQSLDKWFRRRGLHFVRTEDSVPIKDLKMGNSEILICSHAENCKRDDCDHYKDHKRLFSVSDDDLCRKTDCVTTEDLVKCEETK